MPREQAPGHLRMMLLGLMVESSLFVGISMFVMALLWWPMPAIVAWIVALATGATSPAAVMMRDFATAIPASVPIGFVIFGPLELAIVGLFSIGAGLVGDYRMAVRGYPMKTRFLVPDADDEDDEAAT